MAITNKEQGVWDVDQVYNKQNEGDIWPIPGSLDDPSKLFVWGYNYYGTTGDNSRTYYSSPIQVPGTTWMSIGSSGNSAPGYVTLSTKADGTLWAWGGNYYGDLGQNTITYHSSPVQIPGTNWNQVNGGGGGCATKTDGTLWACGYNNAGQLGLNNITNYSSPVQLPGTTWQVGNSKASLHSSSFAIKTDGTLWAWGSNNSGKLGRNDVVQRSSPAQVGTDTNWNTISTTNVFTVATKTDGTAWAWGRNEYGELAQNNQGNPATSMSSPIQIGTDTNWTSITAGNVAAFGTKTDGTLWAWGWDRHACLALGPSHSLPNPIKISSPTQIGTDTNWSTNLGTVATMDSAAAVIKTDGTLWSWGLNDFGQLGHNNKTTYSSPRQIPGTKWTKLYGFTTTLIGLQDL